MKIVLAVSLLALPLCAAETSVELDPAKTVINFTVPSTLHTVHGHFSLKRGSLKFDAATGKASGEIVVDVASGESGDSSRDNRMRKEILESMKFAEAVFTADKVTGGLAGQGESQLDVHGTLQLHGGSHETTLHFKAQLNGGEVKASTEFTIPYVMWGVKNPSNFLLKVDKTVTMSVEAVGKVQ
jgi:polyisoprenoid-binding protein YceI